ncbi:MAG: hypothetical protein QOC64_610 [Solirubrobacteraceae bacterium]|nr:hypothetical protein [Solirubrobacteraceae bacterium]
MSDVSSGEGWAAARIVAVVLAVAALAVAVAAAAAPGAADGAEPSVRLTVTFVRGDGAARHVAHLRCTGARASADGYLRAVGPARACRHARRVARLLTTAPPRQACTQLYGGPERARVTGRIGARRVARSFSRTNGCQIADWARTVPLLPRPTAS